MQTTNAAGVPTPTTHRGPAWALCDPSAVQALRAKIPPCLAHCLWMPIGTPHGVILVAYVQFTQGISAALLAERNTNNRRVRQTQLEYLEGVLRKDQWVFNCESGIFDAAGVIVNLQHRLQACVNTGIAFDALVAFGVPGDPERLRESVDNAARRVSGDDFRRMGVENSNGVAALAGLQYRFGGLFEVPQTGVKSTGSRADNKVIFDADQEAFKYASKLGNRVAAALRIRGARTVTPSVAGFAVYRCVKVASPAEVEEFWGKLAAGSDLPENDARWRLRAALLATMGKGDREILAWCFKAWNLWRSGKNISRKITWDPKTDLFPLPV